MPKSTNSYRHLKPEDRMTIASLMQQNYSQRDIAALLGCSASTVSRELVRNAQGKEMALHKQLTQNTGMAVYFCDPHNPWQRGSNENMNGLVRQYLPKGTDLSGYSQEQLDAIADEINNRPRKGLGVRSPLSVYRELLVNTPQHSTLIH